MDGLRKVIREEAESNSLCQTNFHQQKIAIGYDLAPDFKFGLLKQFSNNDDGDNTYAIAAEYLPRKDLLLKARLNNHGVLNLFSRYRVCENWLLENSLETGFDSKHRIQGIAGSNMFASLKLIYNE